MMPLETRRRGRPAGIYGVKPERLRTDAVARALQRAFPEVFDQPAPSALSIGDLANALSADAAEISWDEGGRWRVSHYSSVATRESAIRHTQKRLTGRHANRENPLPHDQAVSLATYVELVLAMIRARRPGAARGWALELQQRGWPSHSIDRLRAFARHMHKNTLGDEKSVLVISFPATLAFADAMLVLMDSRCTPLHFEIPAGTIAAAADLEAFRSIAEMAREFGPLFQRQAEAMRGWPKFPSPDAFPVVSAALVQAARAVVRAHAEQERDQIQQISKTENAE